MDYDKLFPNRFIKAGMFEGKDVTLTITAIATEELEGDKGKQIKAIVTFKQKSSASGQPLQLVLNKTNGICLRAMFGRETDNWIGKRVTFWPAPISFGDTDIAIRVRGSPDIASDMDIEIKLARKSPRTVKMIKTLATNQAAAAVGSAA